MAGNTSIVWQSASVVILAQAHNPTLFNHDFLRDNRIVPDHWWPHPETTVITPAMARLQFGNGAEIVVLPDRCILQQPFADAAGLTVLAGVATQFAKTLPHVKYRAVGNNFKAAWPQPDPAAWLTSRFLQAGKAVEPATGQGQLSQAKFGYPLGGDATGHLSCTLSAGGLTVRGLDGPEPWPAVAVDVNFHRDVAGVDRPAEVGLCAARLPDDFARLAELLDALLLVEDPDHADA